MTAVLALMRAVVCLLLFCSSFKCNATLLCVTERWVAGGTSRSGIVRRTVPTLGRWDCKRTSVWYVVAIWNWCRSSSEPPVKSSTSARSCSPTAAGTVPPSCSDPTTSLTSLEVLTFTASRSVTANWTFTARRARDLFDRWILKTIHYPRCFW